MTVNEMTYDWGFDLSPRNVTTHVILHHAAVSSATAEQIHSYHRSKGWAGIAYHYYVTKNGEIVRGRPENMRGGHTTDWNYCSIGVCFEGNFEEEIMPHAQKEAGKELIRNILKRYPSIQIGKHSQFGATSCPGKNFPFYEITEGVTETPEVTLDKDEEPDVWASEACAWAVENGLFVGDEGRFRWKSTVSRQELAIVLKRFMEKFIK